MDPKALEKLLKDVRAGKVDVAQAVEQLAQLPFTEMGFAKVDHHRALRTGFAEVIFGTGKTPADTVAIAERALEHTPVVLATRLGDAQMKALRKRFPKAYLNERAHIARIGTPKLRFKGTIAVVSAGTSDLPVAGEACETLTAFGAPVEPIYDVGVAGLHRLLHQLPALRKAAAVIAVAGMEGALPSVLGGLLACPIIAVPTSIGYGASLNGLAALLAMLNSCAAGVSVVNIDNGFGAAMAALRILRTGEEQTV
jgi:NCAIR mutase (PurE)-related protein